ncbi:hypothetical protein HZQ28_17410 [Elizabethkingia anophelis]|nr:hypothetical protein [Elizabethkingia anophelis]MCT3996264.1 hypothetical protein [Elizabethkingia anophelis]MCT3999919.1 hypothetical protein [Elizabethkingia anophelis]MCT4256530.1 hypothetical protein [Elizabethkingia anophelis]HAY3543839.1 hypothetical protein [Elizabethkingia anophelis]
MNKKTQKKENRKEYVAPSLNIEFIQMEEGIASGSSQALPRFVSMGKNIEKVEAMKKG